MWLFKKNAIFAKCSSFNNLHNAKVGVNETVVYYRSLLGLQSPTCNILDFIQNNRKVYKI